MDAVQVWLGIGSGAVGLALGVWALGEKVIGSIRWVWTRWQARRWPRWPALRARRAGRVELQVVPGAAGTWLLRNDGDVTAQDVEVFGDLEDISEPPLASARQLRRGETLPFELPWMGVQNEVRVRFRGCPEPGRRVQVWG